MRRILAGAGILLLAACVAPHPAPVAPQQPQQAPPPSVHTRGNVIGLTVSELVQRFGKPALQIREGNSWKLQFRNTKCVLDAYLYPPQGQQTPYRVTYVEARTPSLNDINQALCVSSLER